MILPILYYGHPMLRKKAEPIKEITEEIRTLARNMIKTMDLNHRGIGLAAPQVGRMIRLFVMRYYIEAPDGHITLSDPEVFINPKLSSPSAEIDIDTEGCLSLPGLKGEIARPRSIIVEAMNLEGEVFRQELTGYHARIIMHENDHLNGVLWIDRVDPKTRRNLEPLLQEIKKKYNP